MLLGLTLLLHTLPPYRPLVDRLAQADAAAIISVERVSSRGLTYKVLMPLLGQPPRRAALAAGHRPPSSARVGLATFRRGGRGWVVQEQGREWLELAPHELRAHPAPVWSSWLRALRKTPESSLVSALDRSVLLRYAARDINALLLRGGTKSLRAMLAKRLAQKGLQAPARRSLRRHLLGGISAAEKTKLIGCIDPPHRCGDL